MIRAEKMILRKTDEISAWLNQATLIYDQTLYYLRQEYFQARKENRKPDYGKIRLYDLVKETEAWKNSDLDFNAKQYVIRKVNDNWKVFYKACRAYLKDKSKFSDQPKVPDYLYKRNRSAVLIFDKTRLRRKNYENNTLSLPKSEYLIRIPDHVDIRKIKCLTVKKYYGKIKLGISYEKEADIKNLNKNRVFGIDIGVENIVSITTDNQTGKSWIVKGGIVKSINQFYNKKLARAKSVLETVNGTKTSKRIQSLHMKRNHMIDYEFHCLSKKIVDLCVENDVGTVVIGHNDGWKKECCLGRKTNQKFVQIPFNDLIFKIRYKTEEKRIDVVVVEESYTSKTDHLVGEEMREHAEYLGERVKRGLFRSSCGKILNADINGAIGIIRKTKELPDAELIGLRDRGDVVSPMVLKYKP